MSVRPPQSFHRPATAETGLGILEYELMSERADSLGRHGLKVETILAELKAHEAKCGDEAGRQVLIDRAADAVWSFFIQREICGLRSNRDVVERYGIPKAVMARLGVVRR